MYLINITVNGTEPAGKREELFEKHKEWFAKNFKEGKFLLLGPYLDKQGSGIIIAYEENREKLEKILEEDVYYLPKYADYEIREFKVNLASDKIHEFQGK